MNRQIQTFIAGCPCIARVATTPARHVRGADPDDDIIDPGSCDIEIHWPRGGRAWPLEAKMTDADLTRIHDQIHHEDY